MPPKTLTDHSKGCVCPRELISWESKLSEMARSQNSSRRLSGPPPPLGVKGAQTTMAPRNPGCRVTTASSCVHRRLNEPSRPPLTRARRSDRRGLRSPAAQMAASNGRFEGKIDQTRPNSTRFGLSEGSEGASLPPPPHQNRRAPHHTNGTGLSAVFHLLRPGLRSRATRKAPAVGGF